jgi:serine/threonine-protein kinase
MTNGGAPGGGTPAPGPTGSAGCPDPQRLAALLVDDAPADAVRDVALHLESCEACRRRLDGLAGGSESLQGLSLLKNSAGTGSGLELPLLRAVMDELRHLHRAPAGPAAPEGPPAPTAPVGDADHQEDEAGFLEPCGLPGYRGKFGPYLVIRVVGRGGMGVVLKAHDPVLNRVVAIKVLSPTLAASPGARRRFVREARAAAAVSHEHVVTIHAVDEAAGNAGGARLPYLVMQFVSGRSLEARLRETGPLRLEEVLRIGMQAAAGLAAAHAQGLVHRDVKPANIMLENGVERVKLTDFGLARAADDASITLTGQVTGTPNYMAPEQARGERVDHRADLFSLGGVLYALCTGRPPFGGADPLVVLRKVCEDEPVPVRQINEDIPPWLADIIAGLMRKDPAGRPQSAGEVATKLGERLASLQFTGAKAWEASPADSSGGPRSASAARSNRRAAVAAAGFLLATIAVTVFVTRSGSPKRFSRGQDARRVVGESAALADAAEKASAPIAAAPADAPVALIPVSGGEPRPFPGLVEAVRAAEPGATIEIRHDGPLEAPAIDLGGKPLRIRAAKGYMPVLEQPTRQEPILTTQGPLVLEGLTFAGRTQAPAEPGGSGPCLLAVAAGPLYLANCRFSVVAAPTARVGCVRVSRGATCVVRNTELYALRGTGVQWAPAPGGAATLTLDNVVASSRTVVVVRKEDGAPATLHASRCTLLAGALLAAEEAVEPKGLMVDLADDVLSLRALLCDPQAGGSAGRLKGVSLQSAGTVLDYVTPDDPDSAGIPSAGSLEAATGLADPTATSTRPPPPGRPSARFRTFIDGRVQFSRDIRAKTAQGQFPGVTDFQVQWVKLSSRGVIAPRRMATLGARPDTVGPGGPYETFRRSPAYETWQHEADAALTGAAADGPAAIQ